MRRVYVIGFLSVLLLAGAGCTASSEPVISEQEVAELEALIQEFTEETSEVMLEEMVEETIEVVEEVVDIELEEDVVIQEVLSVGTYADYSSDALAQAQARGDKVVLFFHAVWCPFCKQLDQELRTSPDLIPSGVTLLKTDFDSSTELKTQYGVRFQHTFVQVDDQGNLVTSWLGGGIPELELNLQ